MKNQLFLFSVVCILNSFFVHANAQEYPAGMVCECKRSAVNCMLKSEIPVCFKLLMGMTPEIYPELFNLIPKTKTDDAKFRILYLVTFAHDADVSMFIPFATESLKSDSHYVREQAALATGRIGGVTECPAILDAFEKENEKLSKLYMVEAASMLCDENNVKRLEQILLKKEEGKTQEELNNDPSYRDGHIAVRDIHRRYLTVEMKNEKDENKKQGIKNEIIRLLNEEINNEENYDRKVELNAELKQLQKEAEHAE